MNYERLCLAVTQRETERETGKRVESSYLHMSSGLWEITFLERAGGMLECMPWSLITDRGSIGPQ